MRHDREAVDGGDADSSAVVGQTQATTDGLFDERLEFAVRSGTIV